MNTTLSLRIPKNVVDQLGLLASATGKSRNFIAVQGIKDFIEREAWQVQEIQRAIKEADAGDFATDEEVRAMKAKWGSSCGFNG